MRHSIEILQLPLTELDAAIENELQENPLLEIDEEYGASRDREVLDYINQRLSCSTPETTFGQTSFENNFDDELPEERPITRPAPLEELLLRQLRLEINDPVKIRIGEMIIGNLDEDGYFRGDTEEIARDLGLPDAADAEEVLFIIQNFEPAGIAARDLKECLLAQVYHRLNGSGALAARIINGHLEDLGRKKFQDIARQLNVPVDEVKSAARRIALLEPKPARNHRPARESVYVTPDITITKSDAGELTVIVHKERVPQLRVNLVYQRMLSDPDRTPEEKDFIAQKIKNALEFMKSIEQRHSTLRQIADYIVANQREFFFHGSKYLKPMILKDVAEALERNESTISRAISHKFIDTPQGFFSIKYFFSPAIADRTRGTVSSRSVKDEIKNFIKEENPSRPLSDQDVYNYLAERGMSVSRRTIAKYRQNMKILPSYLRKV
jgi:RNA polymerase sigma-54 factor